LTIKGLVSQVQHTLAVILATVLGVILAVIGMVLVFNTLSTQVTPLAGASANLTTAMTTADWGSDGANSVSAALGTFVGHIILFGFLSLVIGGFALGTIAAVRGRRNYA